ncbi:MAG: hypothetical protein KY428_07280 [Bacteroidetes bacterium]|nr:hypothetical protein [Bacteroidota bacterium]
MSRSACVVCSNCRNLLALLKGPSVGNKFL